MLFLFLIVPFPQYKYMRIFIRRFLDNRIYLNIAQNLNTIEYLPNGFFMLAYLFLMKQLYLDINYASKNIQYKILSRGSMSEPL